jgi:diguanylate cyclase (GGDEF)-like protein/PAS domain S-box-containing protein
MFQFFPGLVSGYASPLVLLAGGICVLASLVTITLLHRARVRHGRARRNWLRAAAVAGGTGIWAAHFIDLLAYRPGFEVAFEVGLTVLSLIAAIATIFVALSSAVRTTSRLAGPLGGAMLGAGLGGMHYIGIGAMEMSGHVTWNVDLVAASILLTVAFGTAAITVAMRRDDLNVTFAAAGLLAIALASHHFTALGAFEIVPDPTRNIDPSSLSGTMLAVAIAGMVAAILGMSLVAAIADTRVASHAREFVLARQKLIAETEEKLHEEHLRLEDAVNNMRQGLVVFDKHLRLVLCNQRYLEMYGLAPEIARSGYTITELIASHFESAQFPGNLDDHISQVIREVATGNPVHKVVELRDGRLISINNNPLPGGGRICTHEDITASRKAEQQTRDQRLQLDIALNNMSQGLVMFDKDLRLVLCNRRYREMYNLPPEAERDRWTLRHLIERHFQTGLRTGNAEEYTQAVIQDMAQNAPVERILETADGRIISIVNRQLEGGGRVATHEDITERHRLFRANVQAEALVREQKLQLDSAVNNMTQGLCMFDASTRIVLCNQRFLEMYNLSPDVVKPGCMFIDLIKHRKEVGLLDADPNQFVKEVLGRVAKGKSGSIVVRSTDGRFVRAVNRPMPGGGWVTTHEDITEQLKAEELLREQKVRLDTALDNMSQGLVMFDEKMELVLWNRRYAEMYGLSSDEVRSGMQLLELLELRRARGTFSGDPQRYVIELRKNVAAGNAFKLTREGPGGRTFAFVNQPMAGGGWVSTHEDITEQRKAEEQLGEQKLQLDTALNSMSQGLNMFDAVGRLVVCNERYREMYRVPPETIEPGATLEDLVQARIAAGTFFAVDPKQYVADMREAINNRQPTTATMELTDGRLISEVSRPTPDGWGWVVTHEDITERRRTEQERDRSQALAQTVIESVPSTIVVKDAQNLRYVLINRAGEEYFGMPRQAIIGKTTPELFPKDTADIITRHDHELLRTGKPQFYDEQPTTIPTAEPRIVSTTRLPIQDPNGDTQYLLTVVEDRTHRKRAEAQLAHLVHHDALTGLPNRAAFVECIDFTLDRAARDIEPFAVLSLDLDRFKEINDVFGHSVGDKMLCEISRRLQAAVGGAFLARVGGDEFVVIAADNEYPAAAEALAHNLQTALSDVFMIDGQHIRTGLSIGIALFPLNGDDATTLVANADAALYRAKEEGRGTFRFFEAEMDRLLRDRRALHQELRAAIEANQLSLHYQPQARIDREVIGFEALARWTHPTRGVIPPSTFIPLAEESGLIIPLGEWILREACRQAASWQNPLNISINLSPVQFRHGDLPALVHSVLLETGLPAWRLEFEITEGVLIGDFSRAVSILRRLKALGVRIAMDDFGSGYSSLSYLQSFPFDKIKIDQAFISNLETNAQSATIVRAAIGLARGLGVPVVAEGVETEPQLAFLANEACDEVQGYLIGRPRPIEEYAGIANRPKNRGPKRPACAE